MCLRLQAPWWVPRTQRLSSEITRWTCGVRFCLSSVFKSEPLTWIRVYGVSQWALVRVASGSCLPCRREFQFLA